MDKALWPETTATIYTCGWQDTPWYYVGSGNYIIVYSYEVNGHQYSGEYTDGVAATEGSKFTLRYNPDNPEENTKAIETKRERWFTAACIVVVAAAIIYFEWYRGGK